MKREEGKVAIRCLDCFKLYCPRCAKKHFVPVFQAHANVVRAIDRALVRAVQGTRVTCRGRRA
jgi:hypothetical protein